MTSAAPSMNEARPNDVASDVQRKLEALFEEDFGSVVVVRGPPGVGKGRVLDGLVRFAKARADTIVFEGHTPTAGAESYHPFAEIVRHALRFAEHNCSANTPIDSTYDQLAPLVDAGHAPMRAAQLDPKHGLFDAVHRLLSGIAATHRVLVVLHDLHRADRDTLELASYLADELFPDPKLLPDAPRAGLLVLTACEDASTPERARDFFSDLAVRRPTAMIALDGLDLEGLRKYLQSPRVLEKLFHASGGLPLALDALIDALPTNVSELFELRLRQMDAPLRDTLRAVAIAECPVTSRGVADALERGEAEIATSLAELANARTLKRTIDRGELFFTFSRISDLEVTARSIDDDTRARLHAAWSRVLARSTDGGSPALVAHHRLRSNEPSLGVPLAIRAAETHAAAGAFDAAVRMLEEALPHAEEKMRSSILERLAVLSSMAGNTRDALRWVRDWKASARANARAHRIEAELHNKVGEYALALDALDQARRLAVNEEPVVRATIEAVSSESHYLSGALSDAAACCRTGLAIIEAEPEDTSLRIRIELSNQLAKVALAEQDLGSAIALLAETLKRAEDGKLVRESARALINLGWARVRKGESDAGDLVLRRGIDAARACNDLYLVAVGHQNRGVLLHQRGEFGRALDCHRECATLFRRLGNTAGLSRALHNLGHVYYACGDFERARAHNDESLRLARSKGLSKIVAVAIGLEGLLFVEAGRFDEAEARLREAMMLQRRLGTERPLEAMIELAEFQFGRGDLERADATITEIRSAIGSLDSALVTARTNFVAAQIAAARGQTTAFDGFESARRMFESMGRRMFVRDVEFEIGRLYEERGHFETARVHYDAAASLQQQVASALPDTLRNSFDAARSQRAVASAIARLRARGTQPSTKGRATVLSRAAGDVRVPRKAEWAKRYPGIVGSSPKLDRVFHILDRVASSDGTVLIIGESGTGKELAAEAIHRNSPRAKGPFVKLNCAALVETLLLSELFGHERGSFTGAHQRKIGRFEAASGGTIFLDEIGDISPKTQVALLRVLQEREFERVGGGRSIKVDARILCATNRNLSQMVRDGAFREDLYYRLRGLTLDLPPLRERPEDIAELSRHFLVRFARESGTTAKTLSVDATQLLCDYAWPGNVRELENVLRAVALFSEGAIIEASSFDEYRDLFEASSDGGVAAQAVAPFPTRSRLSSSDACTKPRTGATPEASSSEASEEGAHTDAQILAEIFQGGVPLPELKKRIQDRAIARSLVLTNGNITRAAEMLGMRRPRLSQIINASDELRALCEEVGR